MHGGNRVSMVWRRRKSWSRSYLGRKGGQQPKRSVYLRTGANLTNPSDVRGILQLGRKEFEARTVGPDLLIFAHRILPWRYKRLAVISDRPTRDLLFAELEGGPSYSEFHMSSGERSVLRMSKDISALSNALVVASHSAVVIDSVPPEGRIFLERDDASGRVRLAPIHRDIFQKALYGQSRDQLSILCEDAVAEGVIRGVLDVLNVELGLRQEDVVIGRNTGRDEFPGHIRALGKFGKLRDFIVVLDGDSREMEGRITAIAEQHGQSVRPLFLPGRDPPEDWVWNVLRARPGEYAERLGLDAGDMEGAVARLNRLAEGAVKRRDAARAALGSFAVVIHREVPEIARIVGRAEAGRNAMPGLLVGLRERIGMWRRP